MDVIVPFVTGLTTGGLSCLAVQGGLLASSLAHDLEVGVHARAGTRGARRKVRPRLAQPILLFLLAKLAAYTLLGSLLGAVGSVLQLTPLMRAVLLIAIGLFMLGNGLRMLKVHPIFRYFVLEPPAGVSRFLRRRSKNGASMVTPLFLGGMTVFIPCGVTQAMMAVALGTGNPLQGAALMLAFTLGTTPVFFSVAYSAARLGASLEKYLTRIAALAVIVLGLVSVNSGLNLAGSPLSVNNLIGNLTGASNYDPALVAPTAASGQANYAINVTNDGYRPSTLHLAANKPANLTWVTKNVQSCALSVVVPDLNYQGVLPTTGRVALAIPAQPVGTVMRYSCSMGMYTGQLVFDQE